MTLTAFPKGISSFGTPVGGLLPVMGGNIAATGDAKVYFVDPANGSDGNTGLSPDKALDTVSAAYAKTVDKAGDVIYLLNDGNTSGTSREDSTLVWSNDNTHLVGLCAPTMISQRSRISPSSSQSTIVTPQLTVSGNGNIFQNISFFEGINEAVDSTCISVTGSRNYFWNVAMMNLGNNTASSASKRAGSNHLSIAGGSENTFESCYIGLDTSSREGGNANLEMTSSAARNIFRKCVFPMAAGAATPLWVKIDAGADIDRFVLFDRCMFMNAIQSAATTITQGFSLHAAAAGMVLMDYCSFVGHGVLESSASGIIYMNMPIADTVDVPGGEMTVSS